MCPIECEIKILGKEAQTDVQEGTIDFKFGRGKFKIEQGNEQVFVKSGHESIHIFSYPGFEVAHVTLADDSLRVARFEVDEEGEQALLISASNVTKILDHHIPRGQMVEIKRPNFELRIKNT